MYVDPPYIWDSTKGVGSVFTVSVKIQNAENLYGWSFKLVFNNAIVQATGITIPSPSFLRSAGPTIVLVKKYDNVAGYATASEMLWPYPAVGASGSGVLATVAFKVVGMGVTALDLTETKLNTVVAGNKVPLDHAAEDGAFDNRVVNNPPLALFTVNPPIAAEGYLVTFDASSSTDDGWITSYFWDFGDGTNSTAKVIGHTWASGTAGTYTVSLTVTDNNGVSSVGQYTLEILSWMQAGDHPDLVQTLIWPERSVFKEADFGEHETLWAKVGNPTDQAYQVRVDFQIYSKDEGTMLGTVSTPVETVQPHEIKEISADFFLGDHRWATKTGPYGYPYWVKKYWAIGRLYYLDNGEWKAGIFPGANQFKVHPVVHDRAVIGLTANYNQTYPAHAGDTVAIDVTLENHGQQIEHDIHLIVEVYKVGTVGTIDQTLQISETKILTFDWVVPAGLEPGNYVIIAKIDTHPYERDISDQIMYYVVAVA
jgi:PKD repeat protein